VETPQKSLTLLLIVAIVLSQGHCEPHQENRLDLSTLNNSFPSQIGLQSITGAIVPGDRIAGGPHLECEMWESINVLGAIWQTGQNAEKSVAESPSEPKRHDFSRFSASLHLRLARD
jgi:hypothetical protein